MTSSLVSSFSVFNVLIDIVSHRRSACNFMGDRKIFCDLFHLDLNGRNVCVQQHVIGWRAKKARTIFFLRILIYLLQAEVKLVSTFSFIFFLSFYFCLRYRSRSVSQNLYVCIDICYNLIIAHIHFDNKFIGETFIFAWSLWMWPVNGRSFVAYKRPQSVMWGKTFPIVCPGVIIWHLLQSVSGLSAVGGVCVCVCVDCALLLRRNVNCLHFAKLHTH